MRAKILEITGQRVKDALAEGKVCVIAGFQGVSTAKEITTLGRGGSDTTAVALAAAFGADFCEIYTDVTGVFSADPRIVPRARKLARVNVDEMLEMAATGGKVLALRSVEFASTWKVPVVVRSSFTWEPGTWVTEEEPSMEEPVVRAVTHDVNEAKLTVTDVPDRPGIAATVFNALADANVNVDLIVQNTSKDGKADISFTVPKADLVRSKALVEQVTSELGGGQVVVDESIAKVSIIGAGMKSSPGIAARMFATLADNGVNIEMISTSTIRTTCVVPADKVELAMRSLHTTFGLDADSDYAAPLPDRK
jgi:aspartate kinase